LDFDKKDCWAVVWSDTDPLSFAVMEKSRLHIVLDRTADEPITTDAFICNYSDLKVRGVVLDEVIQSQDGQLKVADIVIDYESRQIKEIREMMKKQTARELYAVVEKQPSEALWRALAYKGLDDFDFSTAEKAFLKVDDYAALQMIKRICNFDDKEKQRAEILAY
jgi:WD repeat-containing protein 35